MDAEVAPAGGRVERLWFHDGNLVIQAGNRAFRVYESILSLHSRVMNDMLCVPAPENRELFDDIPLAPSYLPAYPSPTLFPILDAVLRMAHKYDLCSLRTRALRHLSAAFTGSWADHMLKLETALAREWEALWLLPVIIFYASGYASINWSATWKVYRKSYTLTMHDFVAYMRYKELFAEPMYGPWRRFLNADYGCGGLKRAEVCGNMLDEYLLAQFQKSFFHALAEMMPDDCEDGDLCETCIGDQLRD
ncbi:hypothetical protein EV122DRAFT_281198 [Schizophyllum commune]